MEVVNEYRPGVELGPTSKLQTTYIIAFVDYILRGKKER